MIRVEDLGKTYRTAIKPPGTLAALRYFFRRQYRDVVAVRDLHFEIPEGSIVGFLGANGAGKTTTLKMLSGLIQPTTGSVRVGRFEPFRRDRDFLRLITLVMGQKQQLIWDLPALDSLRVNAAVYDLDEATARRRIEELAALLEIEHRLEQPMRKLSLGERMKCELLAALLHEPKVLFLDEPTLGLDINAQQSIRGFLLEYNRRYGATLILTSHYMADITALAERVLVIHQGALVYDGRLDAIVERSTPVREVEIQLKSPVDRAELERFGELKEQTGLTVRLLVPKAELARTLPLLFEALEPVDLSIKEPPIELIMGRLLRDGRLE